MTARVAKLADAQDLGSCSERSAGSTPAPSNFRDITTYTCDANGSTATKVRVLSGNTTEDVAYTYDLHNRLVISDSHINNSLDATYGYDGQDHRISQSVGGSTTWYLVDGNNSTGYTQTLQESSSQAGTPTRSYALGMDVIAQRDATNGTLYLMYDGHGSTRIVLDLAAAIIQRYAYDAFGNGLTGTGLTALASAITSLLYSGEQTDATGMQYLRARYYNPGVGRLISFDTFCGNNSDPLSLHKYAYVVGNPISYLDPTGHETLMDLIVTMGINEKLEAVDKAKTLRQVSEAVKTLVRIILLDLTLMVQRSSKLSPLWKGIATAYYAEELISFERRYRNIKRDKLDIYFPKLKSYLGGLSQGSKVLQDYGVSNNGLPVQPYNFAQIPWEQSTITFITYTSARSSDRLLAAASAAANEAVGGAKSFYQNLWLAGTDWQRVATSVGRAADRFLSAGMVWHHSEIMGVMAFVPASMHPPGHVGGVLLWEIMHDKKYGE